MRALALLCGFLVMAACARSEALVNEAGTLNPWGGRVVEEEDSGKRPNRGLADIKPNPVDAREVVMTLEDAPGSFAFVEGSAQYNVVNNDECGRINEHAGVIERIVNFEAIPMTKVSENEYKGKVYFDLMRDEDYYGRGVCRWRLSALRINMRATGKDGETWFGPLITANQIASGESSDLYLWKGGYPRFEMDDYPDSGADARDRFRPEIRGDLFKISIKSEGED